MIMLVTTVKKSTSTTWMGRPLSDLSKDELIAAVEWCGEKILTLQETNDQFRKSNPYFGGQSAQRL